MEAGMVKSSLPIRLVIGTLFVASVAVAAGIYFIPGVDVQLPPTSAPDLTIAEPYNEATIFLHDNVNIKVDTHTSPVPSWMEDRFIVDLENDTYTLYVDGHYVTERKGEAPALDRGRYAYTVWIPWEAVDPGEHTIMVRGSNKFWNAVSNVVHVKVVDLASVTSGDSYTPQSGDTLQTVAGKFGLSPIMLGAANPNIPGVQDPLSSEKPIYIPKGFEPVNTNPPEEDPSGMYQGGESEPPSPPINKVALWMELGLTKADFIKEGPPAAPTLFRFKEGCNVTLYIRDNSTNELGFYLYRLDPGSTIFERIATFGPHGGDKFIDYADKGLYGKYQYYAAAFNVQGESADTFMNVEFTDTSCLKPETTAYKFSHISLSLNVPTDKVYCYYSLQEGEWSRFPEDPNAFIYPTSNGFDLTRDLSNVVLFSQSQLKLDCWGWQGGSLVYIGAFEGVPNLAGADKTMKLDGDLGTIIGSLVSFEFSPAGPFPPVDLSAVKKIAPPYDLRTTNLIDVCHRHFPGVSLKERADCADALTNRYTILVWEWNPACSGCEAKIDGFKVYQLNSAGESILIATIPDRWQNVYINTKIPSGERYYVRSYLGAFLSKRSNIITADEMPPGFKTASMGLSGGGSQDVAASKYRSTPCTDVPGEDLKKYSYFELVGFTHNFFSTGCLETMDHFYRARLVFDLGGVDGYVSGAHLSFAPNETKVDGVVDATISCAQSLNIVNAVSGDVATSFTPYLGLPKYGKKDWSFTFDVTTAVKDWVYKTKPNLGFLLTGQESGYTKADQSCLSSYGSFNLNVSYFVK